MVYCADLWSSKCRILLILGFNSLYMYGVIRFKSNWSFYVFFNFTALVYGNWLFSKRLLSSFDSFSSSVIRQLNVLSPLNQAPNAFRYGFTIHKTIIGSSAQQRTKSRKNGFRVVSKENFRQLIFETPGGILGFIRGGMFVSSSCCCCSDFFFLLLSPKVES